MVLNLMESRKASEQTMSQNRGSSAVATFAAICEDSGSNRSSNEPTSFLSAILLLRHCYCVPAAVLAPE